MSRKIAISVLVLIIILGGLFYGLISEETIELRSTNNEPVKSERIFKKVEVMETAFADTSAISQIFQPSLLKSDGRSFYALDYETMRINRFNLGGELINTIGKGKGRGPGEMQAVIDYYIDDEFVWVADLVSITISKFKKDGEFIESRVIKGFPRGVVSQSIEKLSVLVSGSDSAFYSIPKDLKSDELSSYGNLMENQARNMMSMEGGLHRLEKGGFIYVPKYASLIHYYNGQDSLTFIAKTPDGQGFLPSAERTGAGRRMITAPDTDISTIRSSLFKDKLYTAVEHRGELNADRELITPSKLFMDVFNVESGEYLYSFVPPSFEYFTIVGNTMITISEDEIHKYEFDNL